MLDHCTMGIDPGKSGAIAVIEVGTGKAWVYDYPGDIPGLAKVFEMISFMHPIHKAVIEKAHAMPGQGVVSMFTFGQIYGAELALLAAHEIPHEVVTARTWQKKILGAGKYDTKERSLTVARRRHPDVELSRKKDHGRADALNMAHYAALK